jgi:hypothetical protein
MTPADHLRQRSFQNGERAEPAEIWKARKFIHEHLGEKISLTDVGQSVHVSPNYLSEKFKQVTGVNFVEYVAHARTEKARDLLRIVAIQSRFQKAMWRIPARIPGCWARAEPALVISSWAQLRCAASAFAQKRVAAPASRTVEDHVKEKPAKHQGEFTAIHNWKKFRLGCRHGAHIKHEIGDGHFAAREKCCDPREQSKGN